MDKYSCLGHVTSSSSDYRPAFLDHFDKKPNSAKSQSNEPENKSANKQQQQQPAATKQLPVASTPPAAAVGPVEPLERAAFQRQFDQVNM
jgi:hypothetical protein